MKVELEATGIKAKIKKGMLESDISTSIKNTVKYIRDCGYSVICIEDHRIDNEIIFMFVGAYGSLPEFVCRSLNKNGFEGASIASDDEVRFFVENEDIYR